MSMTEDQILVGTSKHSFKQITKPLFLQRRNKDLSLPQPSTACKRSLPLFHHLGPDKVDAGCGLEGTMATSVGASTTVDVKNL